MQVIVKEEDGKLYVTAKTKLTYGKRFHTYKDWKISDILIYIKKHHPRYKIETTIEGKGTFISNYREKYLEGTWIFGLKKSPSPPKRDLKPRTKVPEKQVDAVAPIKKDYVILTPTTPPQVYDLNSSSRGRPTTEGKSFSTKKRLRRRKKMRPKVITPEDK